MKEEDWDTVLNTNLKSVFNMSKAALRPMLRQKFGRIINISSVAGVSGNAGQANYSASKAGMIGFTKSMAKEYGAKNITVNAIAPGVFPTDLNRALLDGTPRGKEFLVRTPMRRFGNLEELVGAAVFLSSDAASFVTGHVLVVDGGFLASGVNQ